MSTENLQHAAKLKRDYEDHMRCGRTDAAKETQEERDLLIERMSPLERVMLRTDALENEELMQQVVTVILDRGDIGRDDMVTYLESDGTDDLYMNFIARAIDQCEEHIRDTWEDSK